MHYTPTASKLLIHFSNNSKVQSLIYISCKPDMVETQGVINTEAKLPSSFEPIKPDKL